MDVDYITSASFRLPILFVPILFIWLNCHVRLSLCLCVCLTANIDYIRAVDLV